MSTSDAALFQNLELTRGPLPRSGRIGAAPRDACAWSASNNIGCPVFLHLIISPLTVATSFGSLHALLDLSLRSSGGNSDIPSVCGLLHHHSIFKAPTNPTLSITTSQNRAVRLPRLIPHDLRVIATQKASLYRSISYDQVTRHNFGSIYQRNIS